MKRPDFMTLLGGAAPAARAQQSGERMRRIGVLQETAEGDKEEVKPRRGDSGALKSLAGFALGGSVTLPIEAISEHDG